MFQKWKGENKIRFALKERIRKAAEAVKKLPRRYAALLKNKTAALSIEVRLLTAALLCFGIIGISLPVVSHALPEQFTFLGMDVDQSFEEDSEPEIIAAIEDSDLINGDENESADEDEDDADSESGDNDNAANDSDSDSSSSSGSSGNSSGSSSSGSSSSGSSSSSSSSSSGSSSSGSSSSSSSSGKTKVWVPPVYKTVHHDAIYKSVQYWKCTNPAHSEVFTSLAAAQQHKANVGG